VQRPQKAAEFFKDAGVKLKVVPHQFDFRTKVNPFPPEGTKFLRDSGHEVHFGTMLFHTDNLYESNAPTLMANVLRCFSQGVKACFEIVLMATDAGLVASGETVSAIARTAQGSDIALGACPRTPVLSFRTQRSEVRNLKSQQLTLPDFSRSTRNDNSRTSS
jgi:hypothetical protein